MNETIKNIAAIVPQMDIQLRKLYEKNGGSKKKLWEYTHIKKQLDRRKTKDVFTIQDHIRGMVYAMLSSGISWERVEKDIDEETGRIKSIDKIFHDYDMDYLLSCSPEKDLFEAIQNLHFASPSTLKQMNGLTNNIRDKFMVWEKEYGSIDSFYHQQFLVNDSSCQSLITALSQSGGQYKLKEMAEALSAEYLRNVGYDISKPDRHIRRILGSEVLGCSSYKTVPIYEAMDIVKKIADVLGKPTAEVDYILWSYCAKGYGDICTKSRPMCCKCVAKNICNSEE